MVQGLGFGAFYLLQGKVLVELSQGGTRVLQFTCVNMGLGALGLEVFGLKV